jgi:hypothetical protein
LDRYCTKFDRAYDSHLVSQSAQQSDHKKTLTTYIVQPHNLVQIYHVFVSNIKEEKKTIYTSDTQNKATPKARKHLLTTVNTSIPPHPQRYQFLREYRRPRSTFPPSPPPACLSSSGARRKPPRSDKSSCGPDS